MPYSYQGFVATNEGAVQEGVKRSAAFDLMLKHASCSLIANCECYFQYANDALILSLFFHRWLQKYAGTYY